MGHEQQQQQQQQQHLCHRRQHKLLDSSVSVVRESYFYQTFARCTSSFKNIPGTTKSVLPFHSTRTDLGGVVGDLVAFIRDFDLAELDLDEFSL